MSWSLNVTDLFVNPDALTIVTGSVLCCFYSIKTYYSVVQA